MIPQGCQRIFIPISLVTKLKLRGSSGFFRQVGVPDSETLKTECRFSKNLLQNTTRHGVSMLSLGIFAFLCSFLSLPSWVLRPELYKLPSLCFPLLVKHFNCVFNWPGSPREISMCPLQIGFSKRK